jgi:hypothetical protein
VALGPSEDGGYYLLASRAVHSSLFREMTWSTAQVAAETLRRCAGLGLRVAGLPTWYDVDDAPGLARLQAELSASGGLPVTSARHTRAALDRLSPLAAPSPGAASRRSWPRPASTAARRR